jgi:hypothetical protein
LNKVEILQGDKIHMKIYYGRISGQQELKNILCKLVEVIVTVLAYLSTNVLSLLFLTQSI